MGGGGGQPHLVIEDIMILIMYTYTFSFLGLLASDKFQEWVR